MHFPTLSLIAIALCFAVARTANVVEPENVAAEVQAEPAKANSDDPTGEASKHEGNGDQEDFQKKLHELQEALKKVQEMGGKDGNFDFEEFAKMFGGEGDFPINFSSEESDELDSSEAASERTEL